MQLKTIKGPTTRRLRSFRANWTDNNTLSIQFNAFDVQLDQQKSTTLPGLLMYLVGVVV